MKTVPDEINLDVARRERIGLPEHIYCASKSLDQLNTILQQAKEKRLPLLLTRLEEDVAAVLAPSWALDFDALSRTATFQRSPAMATAGRVAVVCAGSSDVPVARECVRTLAFHDEEALEVVDVGVAGLHRLLARVDELIGFRSTYS